MPKDKSKLLALVGAAIALSGRSGDDGDDNGNGGGNGGNGDQPPDNQAPTADFTHTVEARSDGVYIVLDGSPSSDPDGSIASYEWELSYYPDATKLASRTGQQVEFKIPDSHRYYVSLKVADDQGVLDQKVEVVDARGYDTSPLPTDPTFDRTIKICGEHPMSNDVVHYQLSVSGEIREGQGSLNPNDTILGDGKKAVGQVIGGCDIYEFHGQIVNFDWDGPIDVFVDGEKRDPYTLPDADGPPQSEWKVKQRNDRSAQSIHLAIYTSQELKDKNGRAGEKSLVNAFAGALDKQSPYNYKIWYDLPIQMPPNERPTDVDNGAFPWWREQVDNSQSLPVVAKDSTMLLIAADGGGLANKRNSTVKGMNRVQSVLDHKLAVDRSTNPQYGHVFGALHEIGHNLGQDHVPTTGMAWNDDSAKRWVKTPGVGGNPQTGVCGQQIPERKYDKTIILMYYYPCATQQFTIAPGDSTVRQ